MTVRVYFCIFKCGIFLKYIFKNHIFLKFLLGSDICTCNHQAQWSIPKYLDRPPVLYSKPPSFACSLKRPESTFPFMTWWPNLAEALGRWSCLPRTGKARATHGLTITPFVFNVLSPLSFCTKQGRHMVWQLLHPYLICVDFYAIFDHSSYLKY
jgi:hypothetical protein